MCRFLLPRKGYYLSRDFVDDGVFARQREVGYSEYLHSGGVLPGLGGAVARGLDSCLVKQRWRGSVVLPGGGDACL